jgi:plastocyanin
VIRRIGLLISMGATLVFGLAACGSDDTPIHSPSAERPSGGSSAVTVIAKDISLSPTSLRAGAGDVHFTYRNDGSLEHTLVIEGIDGFRLDVAAKGAVDDGTVMLAPGSYTMYCDVAGHRQAGMQATLTVQ